MSFPFGAVYYRRSNPPATDWERDYATAAEDGMTTFRHWFMWSVIEPAPGRFEWAEFDEQFALAERNGMKTVIAELTKTAPEWLFRRLPHARYERRDGSPVRSDMFDSSAIGGRPGVCLDNDDARELAGRFLRELAGRYRDHPAMGGYDVWNECNYEEDVCYCPASAQRFREWLEKKYGDITALVGAWGRAYSDWADVEPPRGKDAYGDRLDWIEYRRDAAYDLMRWRIEVIKSVDPVNPIIAHGVGATLGHAAGRGADDWRAAAEVDVYGLTFIPARHGDESWRLPLCFDLVRSASRGKPYWYAESQGGPLWMQPQVLGRPREDARIVKPEDVRYWAMAGFATGARGHFSLRWRPLLNGPLFGAFGPYGMDGSRTDRSAAMAEVAHWVNAPEQEGLWAAAPSPADVGIVFAPESQDYSYAAGLNTMTPEAAPNMWTSAGTYYQAATGAYRGFFDNGVATDFVHVDDLATTDREVLYLPFPAMLKDSTVDALVEWVRAGGTLISEGTPGYFRDNGWAAPVQPRAGLADLFGVREVDVEFTPDLTVHDVVVTSGEHRVRGGGFKQVYEATTATVVGEYSDGTPAMTDNRFGAGRAILVGTHPGVGYSVHADAESRAWYGDLLERVGRQPRYRTSEPAVIVREHAGASGRYLWVLNPTREELVTEITAAHDPGALTVHRGTDALSDVDGRTFRVRIPARDAVVLTLGGAS
jgi:beta-galactosidase